MKELGCRELGAQCDFVARGASDDDVKQQMFDHAAQAHPDMLKGMTPEQEQQMRSRMDAMLASR